MSRFVRCRRCDWVHMPVKARTGLPSHCRCGTPATPEWMEPDDGAGLPLGATVTGIALSDEDVPDLYQRRQAARRLDPAVRIGVRGYVEARIEGLAAGDVRAYAHARLGVLPHADRDLAADLVADAVASLHQGNHMAWDIPRDVAECYFALGSGLALPTHPEAFVALVEASGLGDGALELSAAATEAVIEGFLAPPPRRRGVGGAILAALCDLADQHGVTLAVVPEPVTILVDHPIPRAALEAFYARLGFRAEADGVWRRRPDQAAP